LHSHWDFKRQNVTTTTKYESSIITEDGGMDRDVATWINLKSFEMIENYPKIKCLLPPLGPLSLKGHQHQFISSCIIVWPKKVLITSLIGLKLVQCVLKIACEMWTCMIWYGDIKALEHSSNWVALWNFLHFCVL
jgi:hypothetical protein